MSFTVIIDHCLLIFGYLKNFADVVFGFVTDVITFPYLDLSNITNPSLEYFSITVLELIFGYGVTVALTVAISKFIFKWF